MATILVVEDDSSVLQVTAELLQLLGHRCLTAGSGAAARPYLSGEEVLDLVLLDRSLPDMDGLDLLAAIPAGVPVILSTGDVTGIEPAPPVVAILAKPYTTQELQYALARHLPAA